MRLSVVDLPITHLAAGPRARQVAPSPVRSKLSARSPRALPFFSQVQMRHCHIRSCEERARSAETLSLNLVYSAKEVSHPGRRGRYVRCLEAQTRLSFSGVWFYRIRTGPTV